MYIHHMSVYLVTLWTFQSVMKSHAHYSALYPDSGFQYDSGLSQGGTNSGLHPHSCPTSISSSPHKYYTKLCLINCKDRRFVLVTISTTSTRQKLPNSKGYTESPALVIESNNYYLYFSTLQGHTCIWDCLRQNSCYY